jgi:hypothetical protein
MFAFGALLLGAVAWLKANADENIDVDALAVLRDQVIEGVSKGALLGAFIGIFVGAKVQHMKRNSGKVNRDT